MASYYYSNCSTITSGCYIYYDIYKSSPTANGYYSDGTNCYFVNYGNGYVVSVSSCYTTVYINVNGPGSADASGETGSGNVQVPAQNTNSYTNVSGNYITVDVATLTVVITCYGSSNTVNDTCYIYSGNKCSTTGPMFTGLNPYETIDAYGVTSVSPSTSSTQAYYTGNGFRDSAYTNC